MTLSLDLQVSSQIMKILRRPDLQHLPVRNKSDNICLHTIHIDGIDPGIQ